MGMRAAHPSARISNIFALGDAQSQACSLAKQPAELIHSGLYFASWAKPIQFSPQHKSFLSISHADFISVSRSSLEGQGKVTNWMSESRF
jgi:hypothetical protein